MSKKMVSKIEILYSKDVENGVDPDELHYYVQITDKNITKVGVSQEKDDINFWFWNRKDFANEREAVRSVQSIFDPIHHLYPVFYNTIQERADNCLENKI